MTTVPLNPFPAAAQSGPQRWALPPPTLPVPPLAVLGASSGGLCAIVGGVWKDILERGTESHKPPKVEPDTQGLFLPNRLLVGPVLP